MSSGVRQCATRLFLHQRNKRPISWTDKPGGQTRAEVKTHRPAWEVANVPFLLKVGEHFVVELVLVQQRLDAVRVVLQVLEQHLQVPATTTASSVKWHAVFLDLEIFRMPSDNLKKNQINYRIDK